MPNNNKAITPNNDCIELADYEWEALQTTRAVMAKGQAKHGDDAWRDIPPKEHMQHIILHAVRTHEDGTKAIDRETGRYEWEHALTRLMLFNFLFQKQRREDKEAMKSLKENNPDN